LFTINGTNPKSKINLMAPRTDTTEEKAGYSIMGVHDEHHLQQLEALEKERDYYAARLAEALKMNAAQSDDMARLEDQLDNMQMSMVMLNEQKSETITEKTASPSPSAMEEPQAVPSAQKSLTTSESDAFTSTIGKMKAQVEQLEESNSYLAEGCRDREDMIEALEEENNLKEAKLDMLEGMVKALVLHKAKSTSSSDSKRTGSEGDDTDKEHTLAAFCKGAKKLFVRRPDENKEGMQNIELIWSQDLRSLSKRGRRVSKSKKQKEDVEEEIIFSWC